MSKIIAILGVSVLVIVLLFTYIGAWVQFLHPTGDPITDWLAGLVVVGSIFVPILFLGMWGFFKLLNK